MAIGRYWPPLAARRVGGRWPRGGWRLGYGPGKGCPPHKPPIRNGRWSVAGDSARRASLRAGANDRVEPQAGDGMATDGKKPDKSKYGRFAVGIVTVRVAFGILAVVRLTSYKSTLEVLEHWTGEDARPRATEVRL